VVECDLQCHETEGYRFWGRCALDGVARRTWSALLSCARCVDTLRDAAQERGTTAFFTTPETAHDAGMCHGIFRSDRSVLVLG
jgi:hypothetical protein